MLEPIMKHKTITYIAIMRYLIICLLALNWMQPLEILGATNPLAVKDASFLNDVQQRTFKWFWDYPNPQNGLTLDRAPKENAFASIAGVGFALTAYPVAVERGFLDRNQAVEKTLATLEFFMRSQQTEDPV